MGDSQPPSADVDLVGSYARRRGDQVEIVLSDPRGEVAAASALTLHRSGRSVTAPAEFAELPVGRALVARVSGADLRDGVWGIRLGATPAATRLAARLLVQGGRPLVLLWGADDPKTRVPATGRGRTPRQRAASVVGHVLDAALRPLPAGQASRVRSAARSAARRTLG